MGVDTCIYLPSAVQVRDVARVMGILCGLPRRKVDINHYGSKGSWYIDIEGVKVECSGIPECVHIILRGGNPIFDRGSDFSVHPIRCLYHFEPGGGRGSLLMPPSTAFWIALGRRLVEFFGGRVDYNDCDTEEVDYRGPGWTCSEIAPEDGVPWQRFQQRMLDLKPLTMDEVEACRRYAAYPEA